jgi:hypothetical protein
MAVKRLNKAEREAIRNKLLEPTRKEVNEIRKNIKDEISSFIQGKAPDEVIKFHEKYPGLISKDSEWHGPRDFFNIKGDWSRLPERKKIEGMYVESIDFSDIPYRYDFERKSKANIISLIAKDEAVLNKVFELVLTWARLTHKISSLKNQIDCALSGITTENSLKDNFPEAYEAYLKVGGLESNDPCTNIESLRAELGRFKK